MNKNSQMILQDKAGKELEVDILFTFESKVNNKTYIVYTDHSTDSDGQEKVFAGIYDKNDEILNPIEDKDDYILIENILSSIDN